MKYFVDLNGERHEVDLDGDQVTLGDETVSAHVEDIDGTPVRLVTIGREVHRVVARKGATRGSYTLWVDGYRFEGEALDERTRAIRDITAASSKSPKTARRFPCFSCEKRPRRRTARCR